MGHDFSFFIYLFACGISMAAAALLILILRLRKESVKQNSAFIAFVVITFLAGAFLFCERFYSSGFADQSGWSIIERIAVLILYSTQFYAWYFYIRKTLQSENTLLGNTTNIFLITSFSLQAIIYVFFMNEHFCIESHMIRISATCLDILFMVVQLMITAAYIVRIIHGIIKKDTQLYLISISLLLLLVFLWQSTYVIMLFHNSPMLMWAYKAFDYISLVLLLIDIITVIYILRSDFGMVAEEVLQQEEEQKQEITRKAMKEAGLSDREIEVGMLLFFGRSYEEIAEELFISKYTVKRHAHNLYQKLGVVNKVELISRFR